MNDYDRYLVERVHALAVECSEWFKISFGVMINERGEVFLCEETNVFEHIRNAKDLDRVRQGYEEDARLGGYLK